MATPIKEHVIRFFIAFAAGWILKDSIRWCHRRLKKLKTKIQHKLERRFGP